MIMVGISLMISGCFCERLSEIINLYQLSFI